MVSKKDKRRIEITHKTATLSTVANFIKHPNIKTLDLVDESLENLRFLKTNLNQEFGLFPFAVKPPEKKLDDDGFSVELEPELKEKAENIIKKANELIIDEDLENE